MIYKREYLDPSALSDAAQCMDRAFKAAHQAINGSGSRSFPCPHAMKAAQAEIAAALALVKKAQPEK